MTRRAIEKKNEMLNGLVIVFAVFCLEATDESNINLQQHQQQVRRRKAVCTTSYGRTAPKAKAAAVNAHYSCIL